MDSYTGLAFYYDQLMGDVDYERWAGYICEIYEYYGVKPEKLLDIACGTGNITIPLAQKGYDMWGLDLSADMLAIAENKSNKLKKRIKFLNQDMTAIQINDTFDGVICMCDGVNYITEETDLINYFNAVYSRLSENGIFIFDISSHYKLSSILGNNTLYQEKNNINYIWNNNYDEENAELTMYLVFFIPETAALYRKFEEFHVQKAYKVDYLKEMLQNAGFRNISVFDEFSFEEPTAEGERIFFAAVK